MEVISATFNYKGIPIKVENGRIFVRSFGTTMTNHSMHWSWSEIKEKDLKSNSDLERALKERNII